MARRQTPDRIVPHSEKYAAESDTSVHCLCRALHNVPKDQVHDAIERHRVPTMREDDGDETSQHTPNHHVDHPIIHVALPP